MNIKRILYSTDFSDCSSAALHYASKLAASSGATLHVVYVNDLRDLSARLAHTCPNFVVVVDRSDARDRLEKIKPTLSNIPCKYHFVEGEPSAQICALAEQENIDLIVVGSHGRSGLSRILIGSVAEGVMRQAKCPVLIVKKPVDIRENTTSAGCRTETAHHST